MVQIQSDAPKDTHTQNLPSKHDVVSKPSLICDFMELYRYLIDDFVIQYCRRLNKKDFTVKSESFQQSEKARENI